jgi:hypothetical protein
MLAQRRGVRPELAELLTLWAALCGVVSVGAIALSADWRVSVVAGWLSAILGAFTLGCAALALGSQLFIRTWGADRRAGVNVPVLRRAATVAFMVTPVLVVAAYVLPASADQMAYWLAVAACGTYCIGAVSLVAHGARTNASRAVRALYWCAMPLFVAFFSLITTLVFGGLQA